MTAHAAEPVVPGEVVLGEAVVDGAVADELHPATIATPAEPRTSSARRLVSFFMCFGSLLLDLIESRRHYSREVWHRRW